MIQGVKLVNGLKVIWALINHRYSKTFKIHTSIVRKVQPINLGGHHQSKWDKTPNNHNKLIFHSNHLIYTIANWILPEIKILINHSGLENPNQLLCKKQPDLWIKMKLRIEFLFRKFRNKYHDLQVNLINFLLQNLLKLNWNFNQQ